MPPVEPAVADPALEAEPTPAAAAGDVSQGYCIELSVLPDGSYKVSGPSPLATEAAEDTGDAAGSEVGEDFPSIGAALKKMLDIVKENPVGDDAGKQIEAGYGAG